MPLTLVALAAQISSAFILRALPVGFGPLALPVLDLPLIKLAADGIVLNDLALTHQLGVIACGLLLESLQPHSVVSLPALFADQLSVRGGAPVTSAATSTLSSSQH